MLLNMVRVAYRNGKGTRKRNCDLILTSVKEPFSYPSLIIYWALSYLHHPYNTRRVIDDKLLTQSIPSRDLMEDPSLPTTATEEYGNL